MVRNSVGQKPDQFEIDLHALPSVVSTAFAIENDDAVNQFMQ
jgi:hypothetical protein